MADSRLQTGGVDWLRQVGRRYPAWTLATVTGIAGLVMLVILQVSSLPARVSAVETPEDAPPAKLPSEPAFVKGPERPAPAVSIAAELEKPTPDPPAVASVRDAPDFSLEVVRIPPPAEPDELDEFLLTSIRPSRSGEPAWLPAGERAAADSSPFAEMRLPDERSPWRAVQPERLRVQAEPEPAPAEPAAAPRFFAAAMAATQVGRPELRLEIVAPDRVALGGVCPVEFRVTNGGTLEATGVVLLIDLPEELSYSVGRKLEHTIGPLPPGRTHTARLTARGEGAGSATIQARVVTDGDPSEPTETRLEVVPPLMPRPVERPPVRVCPPVRRWLVVPR